MFRFFKKHGHEEVASSSLIPAQDPTLLFTNAGMNQFKDLFLGKEKRNYKRAVSIQKCMRAGGKHNDLDNVGFTSRHLTFFEMLGNFSFGDYFKKEAIRYAWDFLTKEMKLPAEKLYVSIYKDDDESYAIWTKEIGLASNRVIRLGAKDNFWQMGDMGPCGPCTEIYYDLGPSFGKEGWKEGFDDKRYIEIWNNVFMQYDRQADGTDVLLAQTGVDTGMGMERLCSIMQDAPSVYETDLFLPIIQKIEDLTDKKYESSPEIKAAMRVLSDHIRASCFVIADGGSPAADGRGYVLRKIIRRAALFERKLTDKSIFPQLAKTLIDLMSPLYPELAINEKLIISILETEIEKFAHNLDRGYAMVLEYIKKHASSKIISGDQAFKLYDTYGFPLELVLVIAGEHGFSVDIAGFEREMEKQREQSGKKEAKQEVALSPSITTDFIGYEKIACDAPIKAIICGNELVQKVGAGELCWIITPQSPFFVECGGQINDQGTIALGNYEAPLLDLKKIDGALAAKITTPTAMSVGDIVHQKVTKQARLDTMNNHTATHLLQAALIQMLGKQVKQAGSVVTPDYLRFDFTYHQALTPEQVKWVEDLVNEKIRENIAVNISSTTYKEAVSRGVMAIFGEKYNPDDVRVIDVPGFSAELCGGTHVNRTGDIGVFKITSESALSSGVRRIVAVTGREAVNLMQHDFDIVKVLSVEFKVKPDEVIAAVMKQREQVRELQAELKKFKKDAWKSHLDKWAESVETVGKIPFGFIVLEGYGVDEIRDIMSALMVQKEAFYFIANNSDTGSSFIAAASQNIKDLIDWKALGIVLKEQGLRGGGKDMIQGGGQHIDAGLKQKIMELLD
ncbi:MAG: alanine--tRNA ligase [Candidatus Babeliales bacterium]